MRDEHFFKHPDLPFAELRSSKNSGRYYKAHIHSTFSIGAIDRGEVIYQVEGRTVNLRPGSLALINPETLHSCNPAGSSRRSYYVLYLDVEWCLQVQKSLWQVETFCPVSAALLEDASVYDQFIDTVRSLTNEGDLLEKEQKLAGLTETVFLRTCEPAAERSELFFETDRLKLKLSMDIDKDVSLRQLASEFEANPYTLLRHFKAAVGITPHAYRLNCRIELAKQLLQKGLEVSQVALECGFFDQSHFHRQFKALTTLTPKEYQINFIQ